MKVGSIVAAALLLLGCVLAVFWVMRSESGGTPTSPVVASTEPQPSLTGPHPLAVLPNPVHGFGAMRVNETLSHEFVIRNDGEAPLLLGTPRTTCKCTVPSEIKEGIPPGGEDTLVLEWTPKAEDEAFSQEARLRTNDPKNPEIVIVIHGRVVAPVVVSPEGAWQVGEIIGDQEQTVKGYIYSSVLDEFQLTSVTAETEHLRVTSEPLTAEQLEERNAKSGYELTATLIPKLPVGRIKERMVVKTDVEDETFQTIILEIIGTSRGPIQIIPLPGTNWNPSSLALDFGRVKQSLGKTATFGLFVSGMPEGETFRIERVESEEDFVKVDLEQDLSFEAPNRQRFKLVFRVASDSPVVTYEGSKAIKLVLHTNHPDAAQMKFFVQMIVFSER